MMKPTAAGWFLSMRSYWSVRAGQETSTLRIWTSVNMVENFTPPIPGGISVEMNIWRWVKQIAVSVNSANRFLLSVEPLFANVDPRHGI